MKKLWLFIIAFLLSSTNLFAYSPAMDTSRDELLRQHQLVQSWTPGGDLVLVILMAVLLFFCALGMMMEAEKRSS